MVGAWSPVHAGATPTKTLTRDDPREPEVLTQCPTRILGPVHAEVLEFGNHVVDEAVEAAGVLMGNYPTLNVDRHLRNFHWKRAEDIAHYREGLLKAGVPLGKLTLVQSDVRRAAKS